MRVLRHIRTQKRQPRVISERTSNITWASDKDSVSVMVSEFEDVWFSLELSHEEAVELGEKLTFTIKYWANRFGIQKNGKEHAT